MPPRVCAPGSLGIVSFLAAVALVATACGSPAESDASKPALPRAFTTPVAAAQEAGLTVYWVGPAFDAGGRAYTATGGRFEGAEGRSFAEVYYQAALESGGSLELTITTYSPDSWAWGEVGETPRSERAVRESVTVSGFSADLYGIPLGGGTNRVVIVHASGGVVVARGSVTFADGRQVNPLNDPAVLLSVLQNLRPYPE